MYCQLALVLALSAIAFAQIPCLSENETPKPCKGLSEPNCDQSCAGTVVCATACSNLLGPGFACRCIPGFVRDTGIGGLCVGANTCGAGGVPGVGVVSGAVIAPGVVAPGTGK